MLKSNVNLNHNTILVTGAAGFIGSNLVKRLYADMQGIAVIGLDNMNDYYDVHLKEYRLAQLVQYPNFVFVKGNIADKQLIEEVFTEYKPQVVVNLAAQAGVRYSIIAPDAYIESNLIGFFNILEACRNHPWSIWYMPQVHLCMALIRKSRIPQMIKWITLCRFMRRPKRATSC